MKAEKDGTEEQHPFFDQLDRFFQYRSGVAGLFIVSFFVIVAILAPYISPYHPIETSAYDAFQPPIWSENGSWKHILGTDNQGRDVLSGIIYGSRLSLIIAFGSIGTAVFVGIILGTISGYYKGIAGSVILRLTDMLSAFPHILLAILVSVVLGPGLRNAVIAIGIAHIPGWIVLMRNAVSGETGKDYVSAVKAAGGSNFRIIFFTILPNCSEPAIVYIVLSVGGAILDAAALGFLGLGVSPPAAEWGAMIAMGRLFIRKAWWLSLLPGIAITVSVTGFNLFGQGLRTAFHPKLKD